MDRESPRFRDLGLASARLSDERWLEKLAVEPLLLRLPLVRFGTELSVGLAEEEWKSWVAAGHTQR